MIFKYRTVTPETVKYGISNFTLIGVFINLSLRSSFWTEGRLFFDGFLGGWGLFLIFFWFERCLILKELMICLKKIKFWKIWKMFFSFPTKILLYTFETKIWKKKRKWEVWNLSGVFSRVDINFDPMQIGRTTVPWRWPSSNCKASLKR